MRTREAQLAKALDEYKATQHLILAAENERDSIRLGPQIDTEAGLARDADLECEVDVLYDRLHGIRDEAAAIPASSIPALKLKASWVRVSDDERVLEALLRDVEALR